MADPTFNPPSAPDDAALSDEYVSIMPAEGEDEDVEPLLLEDDEDGGLIVTIGEPYEAPTEDCTCGFYDNLADNADGMPGTLSDLVLNNICTGLIERIESDFEARKKRDEQYEEGIRRTGLGKDAPGGAEFEGASKAVHPMITEAAIDYEARVIKELMPLSGPVKPNIVGKPTQEKADRAKRKTDHMNWQIATQIKEARSTLETLLTQVPLGGAQYLHQHWDHRLKRPRWEFVPCDRIAFPVNASDWHSGSRRTIKWIMSGIEVRQRIDSGQYRDIGLGRVAQPDDEKTKSQKATEKVAGKEEPAVNLDDDRSVYEVMAVLEVDDLMAEQLGTEDEQTGDLRPYLISIDKTTRKILSMYRDWDQEDETHEPIDHTFEFPFIYWREGNVGLPHIIGSLSGAATGAVRALLDAALMQTVATGAVLKGSGTNGQSVRPKPGEFVELESGLEVDDIRKKIMPFNFGGPSPVLLQMLGLLVETGKGVVRTSLDELATDTNPNTPVGTTMARMQEGMVVFSSIFGRVHTAFNRVLVGLHRLNRMYLPNKLAVDAEGKEILVYRHDYEGPCDIQPVSDPTVYSDQQRIVQVTAVQARAAVLPQIYKTREVEKWFLELMKIPDPDQFLQDLPQPHELNAVNEGLAMVRGQPVVAFPEQDHLAHLQVHLDFTKSPLLGMNPLIAPKYLPIALAHIAEHIAYYYVTSTVDLVSKAAGVEAYQLMSTDDMIKQEFDRLLANASQVVVPGLERMLSGISPVIQQAMQLMQQYAPKPPMDPGQAALTAATQETQRKAANDQATTNLAAQKLNAQQQQTAQEADSNAATNQTKIITTRMDNDTAEQIAALRGGGGGFTNGESLRGQ